ncbi:MAG: hypothetical protein CMJ65_09860 [Planctomycetaceae bacterium]|jgi:hypothetical protein|nr:hypothetical protein [Planctomycetaceae bacterium]MDP7275907.1 DUF1501 domain-containing protein [Planctomycetaceae bacterium]
MFTLPGRSVRHCDGVSRRGFLTAGAMGLGGLTLADLLRAEDAAGVGSSHKAIINIHLDGGPPQLDTIDMKPDSPSGIRGEFLPIQTSLPGFQICELFPKLAVMADRFSFIRSLVGSAGAHDAFQCQSGYRKNNLQSIGGRPAMGCVINKLLGKTSDVAPAYVDLMQGRPLVRNSGRPGFLGPSFGPFRPDLSQIFQRKLEKGMMGELARLGGNHTTSLTLNTSLSLDRLRSRQGLLAGLDRIRRQSDASGMMDAMDRFTQQAVGILTSGRFANAMDFSQESPETIARYQAPPDGIERFVTSESPEGSMKLLLARRLIEAGVRIVSLTISDFDTHSKNFPRMRQMAPIIDQALTALVSDLEERGMLDDVTIVAWGEFGRTPQINKNGGRDHWPRVSPAIIVGGGCQPGQVIGATDRTAGAAIERPIEFKDVFATLYRNLNIEATKITIADPRGRPQYLLDSGVPVRELI